ncbi:hypothetical protein [Streptomyces griseocarneus]|uniref:hypothetical protein n=1 Tax=Streptomyces griseocarneus TaxID=51201 RepID=UPI00167EBC9D|nr:hypothetical protein [Streptomyces griseocarneus]MBZ6476754.1 hypothetical protein [Streptomyces griseocarneus]
MTLLNGLLEQADKELSELGRTVELAERTNTSMQEQLQVVIAERDKELEDHLTTLDTLQQVRAEADRLRLLLLRQGHSKEVAEAVKSLPGIPSSFEELWERLGELEHLTVTADRRIAFGLDEHPMSRTWAAKGWTAMVSLDSYAAAAHLKLAVRGRIAPRVYFLDDVKGARGGSAGRLVVGYIGPHLTSMMTN